MTVLVPRLLATVATLACLAVVLTACGGGGGSNDDGGGGSVTISGRITFERVPFSSTTSLGLDYASISAQPAREVIVELMPASGGAALATTTTDGNGQYSLTVPANTSAFVRARAQARRSTTPTIDLRVLNNTNGNALYTLDGSPFNTGTANQTKNLLAASGWGGSSYTGTRAAAPFAVLDTIYAATRFVQDNGASVDLPALDVYWSPSNVDDRPIDVTAGVIPSTSYISAPVNPGDPPKGIYVLGLQDVDTDEYDQHVLAHEFQHYLEDSVSRTDTPGGLHSPSERLDLRVAFSEGFANAFSAMVLNNPVYRDSQGPQQADVFTFNLETITASPAGWFNETSVESLAWDLFDTAADGPDAIALGYRPMYEVFAGPLRTTPALTSVYPFLAALKARGDVASAPVNALASAQDIVASDAYGTGENNSGSITEALPIYTSVALNATPVTVCGSRTAGTFNKLGNRRLLRFTLAAAQTVAIRADYNGPPITLPQPPDPDLVLYRSGFLTASDTAASNVESFQVALEAGEYVIEVYEWSHIDPTYSAAQRLGTTCFDISVTG